ncbi:uncharacterized protein LOC112051495 [Bicyclus anynana]|uniref:Uncharacterized protein LOC112051495 n=1 Tax=Bicyclus anynana TaxID=110368 RepID=A0A6J1NRQ9_BICAN|nr:uncharacterized protein LOC112051495 [Bicyclus anynana]
MPPIKKSVASKLLSDDFLTNSEVLENKKQIKRKGIDMVQIPNLSDSIVAKKSKVSENIEACGESRQKTLNVINRQLDTRKEMYDEMLSNLSENIENLEAEYNILKENKQKLEQFTESALKCIEKSASDYKLKIKAFKQAHDLFKKRFEETDLDQRSEMKKLGEELDGDVQKLKQKLIAETKQRERSILEKCFMQAMHKNC